MGYFSSIWNIFWAFSPMRKTSRELDSVIRAMRSMVCDQKMVVAE